MSDNALIEAMAYTLTGHICGQCACSNRRGWSDPTAKGCACRDAAQDALAAIRKTHAVVPREPSETMIEAMIDEWDDSKGTIYLSEIMRQCYRAMLAAGAGGDSGE